MEIDEYDNIYLSEMFEDTIIEVEKQFGSEDLFPFLYINKTGQNEWQGTINIPFTGLPQDVIENELKIIKEKYDDYTALWIGDGINVSVLLKENYDVHQAVDIVQYCADMVYNDLDSIKRNCISKLAISYIYASLPVYQRAMSKVKLELTNYISDEEGNEKKIVDICGRVKTLDSICEKIKRKNIGQYEALEKFDDIAGVRCTCEYLDDIYDVLEYIKKNPLLKVVEIDDRIADCTREGYRGIHVIVTTQIYYQEKLYENIKVEIQLRTAFQNAWSMKTHQLTYKKESIESDEIRLVMKELSDMLKKADEIACKMKNQVKTHRKDEA